MTQPLIGKQVRIVSSANPSLKGISGVVEDETAHLITINGKKIQKSAVALQIDHHIFNGDELIGTYTRLKKG